MGFAHIGGVSRGDWFDKICVFLRNSRGETCNKLKMLKFIVLIGPQISTFEFVPVPGSWGLGGFWELGPGGPGAGVLGATALRG